MNNAVSFLYMSIKFATVFLFGATGEIVNQKSGHLNMGTPGIMYLGALGGILGERIYLDSVPAGAPLNGFLIFLIPVLFAIIFGAIGGAIFSFFTVTLHCNQNVTGLTLTTFGVGVACYFIGTMDTSRMAEAGLQLQHAFSGYEAAGWFGEIFLSQSWFTYLGVIVAIVAAVIIGYTRVGLNLRAVGENAAAADNAGISVGRYRYIATIIGGAIAAIGGAFYELDNVKGMFNVADGIDAFGWLALCIVIFSIWRPSIAVFTSFLFACLSVAPTFFAPYFGGARYVTYILKMVPYVGTVVVLIIASAITRRSQAPANLGVSYFREDR